MTRRDLLRRGLRAFGVVAIGGAFYRRAPRSPDVETLRLVNPDDATHWVEVHRVDPKWVLRQLQHERLLADQGFKVRGDVVTAPLLWGVDA